MSFVHFTDILARAKNIHSDKINLDAAVGMFGWRHGNSLPEKVEQIEELWHLMESPIEASIFPYLVLQDYGPSMGTASAARDPHTPEPGDLLVVPQLRIHGYRLDFAVVATKAIEGINQTAIVAVECDGREFHEAIRDTKRDLHFHENGVVTVRLKGAEIFAEPADAARKVAKLIAEWAQ
jgi:very-short-patch-repair endonuclease